MIKHSLLFGLVLSACGGSSEPVDTSTPPVQTTTTVTTETTEPFDCSTVPELPASFERIGGFTGSEDFAFDADGNYVGVDDFGNIVRISKDGEKEIWSPNFGESAGMAFLPDGTLAIAEVFTGRVVRIRKNGGSGTLIGGMSYPNGVTVDYFGRVYVADQNFGTVLRYNMETDVIETLAEGLYNPNGLALSDDHSQLFVGSFGGGTVHRIDTVNPQGAELFGETPPLILEDDSCDGLVEGDECLGDNLGTGACTDDGTGALTCEWAVDEQACAGLSDGDPCQTTGAGQVYDSICVTHPTLGVPFCPTAPEEVVTSCQGLTEGDACTALGIDRSCRWSWEDVLICDITPWGEVSDAACDGLAEGDDCIILDYEGFAAGTCGQDFGFGSNLTCYPSWYSGYEFAGGLDGVGVDVCDNVYVTEYTLGNIWRFGPEGGDPELAVETQTFWIPNMHWGNGVGGWDPNVMYVQDRFTDELLAVEIGVPGAGVALPVNEAGEGTEATTGQ